MEKKLLTLAMCTLLLFSLTACGNGNIEKFCDGSSIMWDGYEAHNSDDVVYRAEFSNGSLKVEKWEYKDGIGKPGNVVESNTYNYELDGNYTVIIDGDTYTYEISDGRVEFNKKLMGIESSWKQ